MGLATDKPRLAANLVERLAARADRLRNVEVRLGARPRRVFVRLFRWSGGERYHGKEQFVREIELTPPPIVRDEGSIRWGIKTGGNNADGTLRLVEISPRYVESDLDLLTAPLERTETVRIDIVHDARDGSNQEVRSYRPIAKPERDPTGLQWTLSIEIMDGKPATEALPR